MTTITWQSGLAADWNTASDWVQDSIPGAGDTAVIAAGTAELLSGVDPASNLTILLGGPTVQGAAGPVPGAYLETLNNTVGPGVTVADLSAGTEGLWATSGITDFTGVLEAFGTDTLLVLGVDKPNSVGVKEGPRTGASTNTVANPGDQGQFQNNGTMLVSGGAGLLITPLNTLDDSQVSVLIGTIDLDDGTLASTYVTLGNPAGGLGTSGVINLANASTALMNEATNIDVNFQDGTGNRLIFTSTEQSVVITGFQAGDTIMQAPMVLFGETTDFGNAGVSYNTFRHTLEIATGVDGTPFLNYTIDGNFGANDFHVTNDASGDLDITLACFAAGTRIATPLGEVAVERLAAGDMVMTARQPEAPARAVRWVGHRRVDLRRHPDPEAARPVRIRAGAFAEGLPSRDVWLSPDHALLLQGVLVPVRFLVNGATVARDESLDAVTYHHVELASHDVLLAEGLPAESYLDTGNRHQFSNGGDFAALYADFSGRARTWEADACAPLCGDGAVVTAERERLLVRAHALGFVLSPGEDLWLEADGRRYEPYSARPGMVRFVVPGTAGGFRLCSRAGVPAEIDPRSADRRRLGAMIEGITLRRGRRSACLAPDDPCLSAGFHPPERDGLRRWRWTDGAGLVPANALPPGAGAVSVGVRLAGLHPWWSYAPPARQAMRRAG